MIATVHQPNYLPYIGFFEKAARADVFVIYDNTQYKRSDFQNRNRIRTKEGWIWRTVPVQFELGDRINQVRIDNKKNWMEKHWRSISFNYSNAPYFADYKDIFAGAYSRKEEFLSEFNIGLIKLIFSVLGINTRLVIASELMPLRSKGTQALIDICKACGCDHYISGREGRYYLDQDLFEEQKITVEYQDFAHPVYKQVYADFEPNMSVIDHIFNCGPRSMEIVRQYQQGHQDQHCLGSRDLEKIDTGAVDVNVKGQPPRVMSQNNQLKFASNFRNHLKTKLTTGC